jgi:hypothetical protein
LITAVPELAEYCQWHRVTGNHWRWLLSNHPEYAKHCYWKKLTINDWTLLLEHQPQFVEKCIKYMLPEARLR